VAGIPGGPAAVAAGGADVVQYFGFRDQSGAENCLSLRRG
jgi:hypothetical protein